MNETMLPGWLSKVNAFHDAAPAAMSFTQAMTNCTVLLAKEQAMKNFAKKMTEARFVVHNWHLMTLTQRYPMFNTTLNGDEATMEVTFFNDFKETKFAAVFASGTNVEPYDTLPATCVVPPGESRTINFLKGKKLYRWATRLKFQVVQETSFVDSEFPPEDASVDPTGKWKLQKPELWMPARCGGSPSEACLFDQIRPADVWLFDLETDQWMKVVIDELLPCYTDRDGFPMITFSRPLGNEVPRRPLRGADGAAFMCYEDWANYFTNISVCPVGTAPIPPEEGEQEAGSGGESEIEPLDDD
eukprot:Skav209106  [mRNA]  locus=scaffold179:151642:159209:+ [translate_table: standard]